MDTPTIFEKSFDEIFSVERLRYELSALDPAPEDAPEVLRSIEAGDFFDFSPQRSVEIAKPGGGVRQIVLSSTKTRIVQRVLAAELGSFWSFSDRNYAFRRGKSPYKAVMRARHILQKYPHVAKADIEAFFDTIDQEILMGMLQRRIADRKILALIAGHLARGVLHRGRWVDRDEGIFQGDVLSPLLANIYLDGFDRELEAAGVMHLRYADDLLFFGATAAEARMARQLGAKILEGLGLRFNAHKSYESDARAGFEFLGIRFAEGRLGIDTERLAGKITELREAVRGKGLPETVEILNDKVRGFGGYYGRIVDDDSQIGMLQSALEEIVVAGIVRAKTSGALRSKRAIRKALEPLLSYRPVEPNRWIERLIDRAYEEIAYAKPLEHARREVRRRKGEYQREEIKATEIVVSRPGAFLSYSRGRIKVKIKGRVLLQAPVNRIRRILLLNRQCSLSAYLVYECARRKIDIDFIDRDEPYAMLTYHQHIAPRLHMEQLKLHFSPRGLEYAREIAYTKSRNQINLLKYLNRRRKDPKIAEKIETMYALHKRIPRAKDRKELMGWEGQVSTHYWNAFGLVLGIRGFVRRHRGAPDAVNQALNYGYAILYNRVQSALIHEGLNLYYPLYHSVQPGKPTLVYDMVEDFRQPVVDREILSILNRGQKLTQSDGHLSPDSVRLIVENIQERLGTATPSRYGKSTLANIIGFQMNHLKRTILDGSTYKGFVNKY